MDSEEEPSTCSICFDDFQQPKLLLCRHTFCKPCLVDYTKKEDVGEIICPLCRQKQMLGSRGLHGLLDNYFVPLRTPEPPPNLQVCCEICSKRAELSQCLHCSLKLCHSCNLDHNMALKISGERAGCESDSQGSGSSDDDRPTSPQHFLQLSHRSSRTKLIAEFVSSFTVPFNDENPSCIFPNARDTCLLSMGLGPEILEYTLKGRRIGRKVYNKGICGITKTLENKILFSNVFEAAIFEVADESRISVFAKCDSYKPTSLSVFKDGRVASAGDAYTNAGPRRKRTVDHGALQIFSQNGKLLKEIIKDRNDFLFKLPVCVSVNSQNNTVCVADIGLQQVLIMTDEGYVIRKYRGRTRGSTSAICLSGSVVLSVNTSTFKPVALCHDQDGNLVIANMLDETLHLLLSNGDFFCYIYAKTNSFRHTGSLCIDSQSRLWVTDHRKGKVKIFQIISYKNNLQHALR
ncbi:uncharacterized protein LOC133179265 [Saccostrea echinata]|uniref:uncharacterized protein LOC133179265 n=1 Tax=Saccostrea echinata TaxID=191078 RepID=UPI002A816D62|nr:uncharacterized protein LOC133179265 [Saccostrea echinata]